MRRTAKKKCLMFLLDVTIAALIMLTVWLVSYKLPRSGVAAAAYTASFIHKPGSFNLAVLWSIRYRQTGSVRVQSVLAGNGDSYSNNRHKNNGTIIKNGVIYRNRPTDAETCVLNWDGTMDIYAPGELDIQSLIDQGAYHLRAADIICGSGAAAFHCQTYLGFFGL